MTRLKTSLLAATLLAVGSGAVLAQAPAAPSPAAASTASQTGGQASTYDPAQLPAIQGKVAQYTLTPRGDVDGLILQDGTEVHVPPHVSTELVFAVRPGDTVTIHGLKARVLPMVMAMSVTNDASHVTVAVNAPHGPGAGAATEAQGKVKAQLHGPRGELNGVLLEDGTVIHLPPPEAERLAAQLAVGQALYARGEGISNPLGRVVAARAIGASKEAATEIRAPGPGMGHWMHAMMHGGHGPRGEHGPGAGPDGAPPRP